MLENIKPTVLIIDDEYSICIAISGLLEEFGCAVFYAQNADDGLMLLKKNPQTDIVLLDIDLGPGLSGDEVLPKIKAQFKYVQVIMFTSQSALEMGVECIKKGAMDYLTKPFQEKKFFEKVPIALEKKKLLRLNDLYMGILVHDLNNPVQYSLGALEFLKPSLMPLLSDQQKDLFQTAQKGVEQIRVMIANILTISKFENGLISLKSEGFSIAQEVKAITAQFDDEMVRSHRTISVCGPKDDILHSDRELFSRILLNILSNAVRYTPYGGNISIILNKTEGSDLSAAISNTGSFIEEEMREVVFDKFASVHLERKPTGIQNFGLGLTFCKLAVGALGGAIRVESTREGPETTFHFSIKNHRGPNHGA